MAEGLLIASRAIRQAPATRAAQEAFSMATWWLRREMRRAALLRCSTPLVTALSTVFIAVAACVRGFRRVLAGDGLTQLAHDTTHVCAHDLIAAARFSDWRCRLIADL